MRAVFFLSAGVAIGGLLGAISADTVDSGRFLMGLGVCAVGIVVALFAAEAMER